MPGKFTVVSLFAGCGGSSLGYKLAGGEVLAAVEWEQNACDAYARNHPHTRLFHRDITTLAPEEIMEAVGLQVGELDILDGSPPCQGFSTVGKRQISDPRNQLFKEYVRMLAGLQPKVLVMENVSGLVQGRMKPVFVEILITLKNCGYNVSAKLMDAQYYGVPQRRKRVIFIGVREDLARTPLFPVPQTIPVTVREAFQGLKPVLEVMLPKGNAAKLARCIPPGKKGSHVRQAFGGKASDFSLIRLAWHHVSPTICKTLRPGQCGLLHPEEHRFLSIAELKRLASFPDDYRFVGSFEEQWARIGNSVPPLLMKVVASHIQDQILFPTAESRSYKKGA